MAKEIQLTNGGIAIVDDDDFDELNKYKWFLYKHRRNLYCKRTFKSGNKYYQVRMHQDVIKAGKNSIVDHINNNGLDNRKSNLRLCSNSENLRNRTKNSNNKSGYKGVCWKYNRGKWVAQICVNNNFIFLGYFNCLIKAAKTYNEAAIKYHGEFAKLNII